MRWVLAALFLAALVAVAFVGNNYAIRLATFMSMYAVLALSWNFIGGLCGYPSFATAAFFGLGAYAGAVAQTNGLPMFLAWPLAGLVTGLFAMVMGAAILHLKGHYFAIASLVVAEVLRELVNSATELTGGGMGLNLPILRMEVTAQAQFFYFAMLTVAVLTFIAAWVVLYGRIGFGLRCIQQNEEAAKTIGINAKRYKIYALVLSALFVGPAGAIYASWINYIEPLDVFDILNSVKPIVMVLLGGVGTLLGPVLGAMMFLALEELIWRNFLTIHAGLLGLIVLLLVLFLPNGLLDLSLRWGRALRLR